MCTQVKKELSLELFKQGVVKFGNFTLKSGKQSEIYFDLRQLTSNPVLLTKAVQAYMTFDQISTQENLQSFDLVCGVAYTGIPIATIFSHLSGVPMIFRRKESKKYGTKQEIEGTYQAGQRVLLLDDVITSGGSLLETKSALEAVGLIVVEARVLIDRRDDSNYDSNNLIGGNVILNCVMSMRDVLEILHDVSGIEVPLNLIPRRPTYQSKIKTCGNPISKRLLTIMEQKQTNLIVSADVNSFNDLLSIADSVGPDICVLKIHADIIDDFSLNRIKALQQIAIQHDFLLMEDRKFSDIGTTVQRQFAEGIHQISSWADIITCHSIAGEKTIEALIQVEKPDKPCGILLIGEMSSKGNLITEKYTQQTKQMAEKYSHRVMGLVSQHKILDQQRFIHATPGVNIEILGDQLGQQYRNPDDVIEKEGCDLMIVGRGIYQGKNKTELQQLAHMYRIAGWSSYKKSLE